MNDEQVAGCTEFSDNSEFTMFGEILKFSKSVATMS